MYDAYVSVDLGRQHDYTAIIVAEEALWTGHPPELDHWAGPARIHETLNWQGIQRPGWVAPSMMRPDQREFFWKRSYQGYRPGRPPLLVRHIERIRGRAYTQVVAEIVALMDRPPLSKLKVALVVDAGGVGVAVLDFMRQQGLEPFSVTATAGNQVNSPEPKRYTVPKRELVAAAQIALAEGRLRIASGLAHAPTLTEELAGYQVKISAAGHDSYSAREGQHDDLVFAAAQLVWFRDFFTQPADDAIAAAGRMAVAH